MTNKNEFQQIVQANNIGQLGIMTDDGYPRVVPINFVTIDDRVYFHGAGHGEKFDAFDENQKVTFSVDLPYAMIPSYWQDAEQGCRANQFFKSVLIRGRGVIVEDLDEKAVALQALMEKHQPEGRFRKITASEELYLESLEDTTIFRIDPDQVSVRSEMGQRLAVKIKTLLIEKLEERGSKIDLKTVAEIRKMID